MQGKPIVVLMAEDDPAHAEIVRRNLEDCRIACHLERVVDGQEALDYLYRRNVWCDAGLSPRPGLILLDLRMPRVDGLEVLKTIKNDAALANIPVVILTTSATKADIAKAYSFQVNSYLVKPLSFDKFSELIESIGNYWLRWNQVAGRKGLSYE